jgi:hypothetical protein
MSPNRRVVPARRTWPSSWLQRLRAPSRPRGTRLCKAARGAKLNLPRAACNGAERGPADCGPPVRRAGAEGAEGTRRGCSDGTRLCELVAAAASDVATNLATPPPPADEASDGHLPRPLRSARSRSSSCDADTKTRADLDHATVRAMLSELGGTPLRGGAWDADARERLTGFQRSEGVFPTGTRSAARKPPRSSRSAQRSTTGRRGGSDHASRSVIALGEGPGTRPS